MSSRQKNSKVDIYLNKAKQWQSEMTELRRILLETELVEEFKWYQPCYTYQNSNIVIISSFKDSSCLGFFKGVLLKDKRGILEKPGENSQSSRFLRFTSVKEILSIESTIKSYIKEAIDIEKAGLKVELKKTEDFSFPQELLNRFQKNPNFKKAFEALTPGRQRGYLLFFSAAKQSKTREARIDKYTEQIFKGKGIHD